MPHNVSRITTIAVAFGLALVLGFVAVRLELPALVGYLVAGIIIGPATPGFMADLGLSRQLAGIGVMLLVFGVGLHVSIEDLLRREGGTVVFMGEHELATAMTRHVLERYGEEEAAG